MKSQMAPDILLVIVLVAAVGAVALRRRPELQAAPGRPAPVTVTPVENQARPAVIIGTLDGTGHEMARPPAPRGGPAITVDQTQLIFHELHAEGRNTLCAVCDSHYAS